MFASEWKTVLMDINRASEFTGDDVDRYSELCDLGDNYEFATVFIPTIDSAGIAVVVQRDDSKASVPVIVHMFDADAAGSFQHITTAATTTNVVTYRIGGVRYLRLFSSGVNQTADRTFYVRGFNLASVGAV